MASFFTAPQQMFEVVIPPGVAPGGQFTCMLHGRAIAIQCPLNATPGARLRCPVPPAIAPPPNNGVRHNSMARALPAAPTTVPNPQARRRSAPAASKDLKASDTVAGMLASAAFKGVVMAGKAAAGAARRASKAVAERQEKRRQKQQQEEEERQLPTAVPCSPDGGMSAAALPVAQPAAPTAAGGGASSATSRAFDPHAPSAPSLAELNINSRGQPKPIVPPKPRR